MDVSLARATDREAELRVAITLKELGLSRSCFDCDTVLRNNFFYVRTELVHKEFELR